MLGMLGIEDPWVSLAYILCIASAALCVVWGAVRWNRSDDAVEPVDVNWARHEQKTQDELE